MKPKRIAQWEITREKGMKYHILIRGVLAWGLPMFIFMTFVIGSESLRRPFMIGVSFVVWMIAGFFFGWMTWRNGEKSYTKYLENRHSRSSQ